MLLLGQHQGLGRAGAEDAIGIDLQELLEHDGRRPIGRAGAALLNRRHDEGVVAGAGVDTGRGAEPCGLAAASIGVDKCALAVPVDTDTAKTGFLGQNTEADRVDGTVFRAPVSRDAVQVATLLTAADLRDCVVLDTAIAAGDADFLAELVPDALNLIGKLLLDHLRAAPTRASELAVREVLGQGGFIAAQECDSTHSNLLFFIVGQWAAVCAAFGNKDGKLTAFIRNVIPGGFQPGQQPFTQVRPHRLRP